MIYRVLPIFIAFTGFAPGNEEIRSVGDTHRVDGTQRAVKLLEEHCLPCHGKEDNVEGDLDLREFLAERDFDRDAQTIDDILSVIQDGEMPPEGEKPLPAAEVHSLLKTLEAHLATALAEDSSLPPTPIRRMNRFQYANSVQDLFDLRVVVFSIPERMLREYGDYFDPASGQMPDRVQVGSRPLGKSQMIEPRIGGAVPFPQDLRAEHGFDNRADHLSLSPRLMSAFVKLANSILDSPDFNSRNVGTWDRLFADLPSDHSEDRWQVLLDRTRQLLNRAFREHVDDETVELYASHARSDLQAGRPFPEVMKKIATAVLVSPRFLYFYTPGAEDRERKKWNDYALATRLALFLHGGLPDGELLRAASSGDLAHPDRLAAEATRMMNDRKMKRFCDGFASQWLQLERIISSTPDRKKFKGFYRGQFRSSMWMMSEPLLLFETVFIENRPVVELIDPDFTWTCQPLEEFAAHGRLPQKLRVTSMDFRRKPVGDRRFGGVITNAAVLTMTSGETRTQPITRGAWLLTVILNNPPEPPPADVPPLPEKEMEGEDQRPIREIFAVHRQRKDCAACHNKIDPLGFALENYDAVGRWRDHYANGTSIDASGELFRQQSFQGGEGLKDALMNNSDRFVRAFVEHLLSYALGRELTVADNASVIQVVDRSAPGNHRLRDILREVVLSPSFRNTQSGMTQ